jgi:PAS domain S-box-containing protein
MNPDQAAEQLFTGSSEMALRMRAFDWSQTQFGPIMTWPQSLRSALSICLNSRFPIAIYWGADCLLLYNDAWRPIVGNKHPWSLGRAAREVWSEIWDDIGPELASVLATGEGTFHKDELLAMYRFGYTEECFFEYTFNPIQGQDGVVDGVFNIVTETTYRVLNDRRSRLLQELASKTGSAKTVEGAYSLIAATLKTDPADIPFALLYRIDPDAEQAQLCCKTHLTADSRISPDEVNLTEDNSDGWPIVLAARTAQPQEINNLESRFGELPSSFWPESPQEAVVLPIMTLGQNKVIGILVAAASPRRKIDPYYRDFFSQVAEQIAKMIMHTQAYEDERQRAEALAELDRAKTLFFSNVSHEFRTPLTLMLGPAEDALNDPTAPLPPAQQNRIELVQRNGQRLLKLVNTLLDFSRIEAGRVEAVYEPTDLAAFTTELASMFRSAIERANLQLVIDCPPLPEPVYIDREMWEKIVFNLLSNAFKFTFIGEIAVRLKWIESNEDKAEDEAVDEECDPETPCPEPDTFKRSAVLEIHDTGIGIPATEIPHLFERFHRVKGAQGRSFEGSGIGLSLVQELVKLHQGTIEVNSVEGEGTCFAIAIPMGTAHLPQDRIRATRTLSSTASSVNAYVEEALRWLPEESRIASEQTAAQRPLVQPDGILESLPLPPSKSTGRILLVDDNVDMREYVKRLLNQQYQVETAPDGLAALAAVRQQIPDLVLADIMMPNLDGFGLLRELRADPQTQEIPIILLSARAGEEARIEGLEAGADDYLIKPFSARELLARVEASLKLAQLRREALQKEQDLRAVSELAQQQTEAAFRRINQLLESMSDAFISLDQDWRITYQNTTAERINNKPRAEVLGKTLWEEWPAAIGSIAEQQYRQAIAEKIPVHFEQHYYEPPDHDVWLEVHAYPFDEGLGIFYRDISDRKQAEQEREHLLAQEQAARTEAERANRIKDEFLAVLSHELRSPLTPILGWSKLLQSEELDADMRAQALAAIERNAKLQSDLIEDLLDVSRILQGKLSLNTIPVNLATSIQSAVETVQLAAQAKSIQIAVTLENRDATVLGDPTRLQQIVWNLLSNAVKFTPGGGQVSVQLRQVRDEAEIIVSDTGKGISANFLPHVFEYFRQADSKTTRKFGGLGLGLAIVRHLVELHGGTIKAESPGEGLGATFTVKLPLAPTRPGVDLNRSAAQLALDLADIDVLVIDDEADSREFLVFLLKSVGARVTTATSASEGLLSIIQSPPDIVLSDVGMPDMDGHMLMRQVRALPPEQGGQVKAIALTGFAGEVNQQQAIAAGFQKHLSKPIEPDELVRAIVSVLRNTPS